VSPFPQALSVLFGLLMGHAPSTFTSDAFDLFTLTDRFLTAGASTLASDGASHDGHNDGSSLSQGSLVPRLVPVDLYPGHSPIASYSHAGLCRTNHPCLSGTQAGSS